MKTASLADSKLTSTSPQVTGPMMIPAPFEMMIAAHRRMVEQIGSINKIWLTSVQDASSTGSDLAVHLLHCGNSAEGIDLCNNWLRQNARRFVADSQKATQLWMDLCSSAFDTPSGLGAASRQSSEGDDAPGREKQPASAAA